MLIEVLQLYLHKPEGRQACLTSSPLSPHSAPWPGPAAVPSPSPAPPGPARPRPADGAAASAPASCWGKPQSCGWPQLLARRELPGFIPPSLREKAPLATGTTGNVSP